MGFVHDASWFGISIGQDERGNTGNTPHDPFVEDGKGNVRHTPEARKAPMRRKRLVILIIYPPSLPPLPPRLHNAPVGRRRLGIPIIRDRLVPRIGEGVKVVFERGETDDVE